MTEDDDAAAISGTPDNSYQPPHGRQGFIVVGSVLALLVAVAGITASSINWSGTKHKSAAETHSSTTAKGSQGHPGTAGGGPTTFLPGTTEIFVTTTIPVTTTSSTTTTTTIPTKGTFQVLGGPVSISADAAGQLIVVNTSKRTLSWFGTPSLTDLVLEPQSGRLGPHQTRTVRVSLAGDAGGRTQATIRFAASTGDDRVISVSIGQPPPPPASLTISTPSVAPNAPDCSQPTQVAVQVSGGTATTVLLVLQQPSGAQVQFAAQGGGRWSGVVPTEPGGIAVSGVITAATADGRTAQRSVQFFVAHRSGVC